MANHKYIERKWKNGRWEYRYRTDDRSADQLRLDTRREQQYRNRMVGQSRANFERELKKDRKSKAAARAEKAYYRNMRLYDTRIASSPNRTDEILFREGMQKVLREDYKRQSLGTKIKADARSAADDIKEKTAPARKAIAEKTATAKKMMNDATRKVSSLSSKAVGNGKATVSKILDKFKKK